MAKKLLSRRKIAQLLPPIATDSDGKTGLYVDYNGWNRATIICSGGAGAGDSDDTLAFQVYRIDDIAASAAAASDHVAITAGTTTLGPGADSDANLGLEFIELDFVAHSLDSGCLTITATSSLGGASLASADIILYEANGAVSDTSMTIVEPASS